MSIHRLTMGKKTYTPGSAILLSLGFLLMTIVGAVALLLLLSWGTWTLYNVAIAPILFGAHAQHPAYWTFILGWMIAAMLINIVVSITSQKHAKDQEK